MWKVQCSFPCEVVSSSSSVALLCPSLDMHDSVTAAPFIPLSDSQYSQVLPSFISPSTSLSNTTLVTLQVYTQMCVHHFSDATPTHPEPHSHPCAPRAPSSLPPFLTEEVPLASTTQPSWYFKSIPESFCPKASACATCLLPSLSELCPMPTVQGDFFQ